MPYIFDILYLTNRIFHVIYTRLFHNFPYIPLDPTSQSFMNPKILSPSSNVHIDVVNHVAASLLSHSYQFQHTWRDYAIVFLLIIVIGTCIFIRCGITTICMYRRLLFKLLHRSSTADTFGRTTTVRSIP